MGIMCHYYQMAKVDTTHMSQADREAYWKRECPEFNNPGFVSGYQCKDTANPNIIFEYFETTSQSVWDHAYQEAIAKGAVDHFENVQHGKYVLHPSETSWYKHHYNLAL